MLPLAAIALTPVREPMIAFVARIYYPPGDKRVSHSQLFVSDFDGSHRRQLTHGESDIWHVEWVGKGGLAWEADGVWYESAIRPFHPRRLKLPKDAEVLSGTPRGDLVFCFRDKAYRVTESGTHQASLDPWKLASRRYLGFNENSGIAQYVMADGEKLNMLGGDSFWEIHVGDHTFKLSTDGMPWLEPEAARARTLTLRGQDVAGASHGRNDTIYTLDLQSGKLAKVVGDLAHLDYRLDSPYYAGLSDGGMGVTPYGRKRVVWSSSVYAGDLRTGHRWLVLGGTVWAHDVAVQPG